MTPTSILLIGAYGRMGMTLYPALKELGHEVFRQGRKHGSQLHFDPIDSCQMNRAIKTYRPKIIINLAALTNVDLCESSPYLAYLANTKVAEVIAMAIKDASYPIHFIQISTDQVYDDIAPSREEDAKPANVYAISKYAGELAASTVSATIFRTNYIGRNIDSIDSIDSIDKKLLSDWIIHSALIKRPITLFDDVFFSPLHIKTLCKFISKILNYKSPGVFNLGSIGQISKAAFGQKLIQELGIDYLGLTIGKLSDVNLNASRPYNMSMNSQKFVSTFNIIPPDINQEISLLIQDYKNYPIKFK